MATEKPKRRSMKEKWKALLAEYGKFAIIIYFSLFAISMIGFSIAISAGLDLGDWTGGKAGTIAAAWVATKIAQPIRIGATLLLTPLVAGIFGSKSDEVPVLSSESDDSEE